MTDNDNFLTENEPESPDEAQASGDDEAEALAEVDELGGDAEILESLPDEGSPLHGASEYDELEEALTDSSSEWSDGEAQPDSWSAEDGENDASDSTESFAYYETEAPAYDFLDVDAAIASVAALGDSLAEREEHERAQLAAVQDAEVEREEAAHKRLKSLASPPLVHLRRGQLASVVPALLLMGIGTWLTFATTAPDAVPLNPLLVAVALLSAVIVTLLAYWLASGRWSRGTFFFAILLALIAGSIYYETTLTIETQVTGPLVLAATGLAFALTGLLSRPTDRRLLLPGILFLVAAAVSLAAIIGFLPATLLTGVAPFWPALVAVLVVLWLLPVLAKRRG